MIKIIFFPSKKCQIDDLISKNSITFFLLQIPHSYLDQWSRQRESLKCHRRFEMMIQSSNRFIISTICGLFFCWFIYLSAWNCCKYKINGFVCVQTEGNGENECQTKCKHRTKIHLNIHWNQIEMNSQRERERIECI